MFKPTETSVLPTEPVATSSGFSRCSVLLNVRSEFAVRDMVHDGNQDDSEKF